MHNQRLPHHKLQAYDAVSYTHLVREDDAREGLAIEHAGRSDDAAAEGVDDRAQPVCSRLDDLSREHVGVDDRHPMCAEPGRDCALTRSDAAGDAEEMHA